MKTILEALQTHAIRRSGDVFCHFVQGGNETKIRYGDLMRGAERYAALYQQNGIEPGGVILIILRHTPELFYSFLGAILAGAVPSFMPYPTSKQDPRLYWHSHRKLFERIGPGAVLTYPENIAPLQENIQGLPMRLLTPENAAAMTRRPLSVMVKPHKTALLQHSSGTTGLKKGVALSNQAVIRQVSSYADTIQLSQDDCIVSWLPLYHDMGLVACFLMPLITGTTLVQLDPFEWVVNPVMLFDAIKKHQGTLCWLPNFAFHHLCRTVRPSLNFDLTSMRAWINCSEPCRAETFELFERKFSSAGVKTGQLQVCYAMAETVFAVTQTTMDEPPRMLTVDSDALKAQGRALIVTPDKPHHKVLSTGRTIPGMQVCIVNNSGALLQEGCIGEVAISGNCLFTGYYKFDEETRRKLRGGWYHSGDLGFLYQGELYITGRKNDLIIVHGRNYYAHELEFLVNQVPGVHPGRNVAAGWFRPEIGSQEVVIITETKAGEDIDRPKLVQDIKQAILDQTGLLVFDVYLVDSGWLVKTTSGKLSRHENLNKYLAAVGNTDKP
jgi:acyl-CoA synthetase (AMP-forming)/AMP-acid ligase II